MFNLQTTVTTNSYLSLEKFREYVYMIMYILSLKRIFELSLNLWENLTSGFSKTRMYLISQIEESWRLRMSWVLEVEFWWQSYQNRRLHTDWVMHWFCAKSDSIGKNSLLFKMSLTPIYPVSSRPFFLLGMCHFASSLLNLL